MRRARTPYLYRRHRIFYFRMVVPERLRTQLGMCELKVSLRTSDPDRAKRICRALVLKAEAVLEEVSTMHLDAQTCRDLVRGHFSESMSRLLELHQLWPEDQKFAPEHRRRYIAPVPSLCRRSRR